MSKSVFNKNEINFTKEPMFFGADQNVQRYDIFKYPQFDKLNQTIDYIRPAVQADGGDLKLAKVEKLSLIHI